MLAKSIMVAIAVAQASSKKKKKKVIQELTFIILLGHYPNFAREDVRTWWGQQYKYLFDTGLEFVWQDIRTF